jgi:hypothetical protein
MVKIKSNMKMDFVSSNILNSKTGSKRIDFILNRVKDGSVLVTDGVLKPDEEMELIRETMRRVDDGFPGIEVASLKRELKGIDSVIDKLKDQKNRVQSIVGSITGRENATAELKTGLTLIGPAKIIKRIKKNPESFSVFM